MATQSIWFKILDNLFYNLLYQFALTQFVAGTQAINSLAFVFDGVNFGASDYTFSAYSTVICRAYLTLAMLFFNHLL